MKISLITTILNEENSITEFLESIKKQSKKPNEVIIVDGGSTDSTVDKIKNFKERNKKINIRLLVKVGNRSIGRNEAIKKSKNEIVVIADAGTILEKNWLKNISSPFKKKNVDVVAGYYEGRAKNIFQKCLIPYVLVMPDRVSKNNFLPATRSMAIRKNIWKKIGKFNELLSHNEDYEFAKRLENKKINIYFQKQAIVYWTPVNSFKKAFKMFYRFALGDIESKIFRPKVSLIFLRYFYFLYFILLCGIYKNIFTLFILSFSVITYFIWCIVKNYKYVESKKALVYLPLIQMISDAAVIAGSISGFINLIKNSNKQKIVIRNFVLFFSISIYSFFIFLNFNWGAPNQNRIYPYHMDEWHQFQSVVNTYRFGTPNTEGSANGTMFQFTTTGLYLMPFIVSDYISGSIRIEDLVLKEKLFNLLRFNTYLYGLFSIVMLYLLLKYLKIKPAIPTYFFILSPIFIILSGYFKYDIALLFWILLSILAGLNYIKNLNPYSYLFFGLFSGMAISTKISALPLVPIYLLSFLFFEKSKVKNYKYFFVGILNLIFVVFFFGLPDTLFGRGNIYFYLYDNIINVPHGLSENLNIHINQYFYLFTKQYTAIFGLGIILAFLISSLIIVLKITKEKNIEKELIFVFLSFALFLISLIPLGLISTGNRSLVLLPFMIILIGFGLKYAAYLNFIKITNVIFIALIILQLFSLIGWLGIKYSKSSQEQANIWIQRSLRNGEELGIENIPIYQMLPDEIVKNYYLTEYGVEQPRYKYKIIDSQTKKLPKKIIITNADIDKENLKDSAKIRLVKRLESEQYHTEIIGTSDLRYFRYLFDPRDYYFSALITSPVSISIYSK